MGGEPSGSSLPQRTLLPALPEPAFDRFAELTRRVVGVPTALVSLVDRDRQAFPGAVGLPEPWQTQRETPLSHSFCQHVVLEAAPLVISDAREDPALGANLAIPDLGVVAYAGMPLTNSVGQVIGSLCAIDSEARDWTETELANLADLAAACSAELQLREMVTATQVATARVQELIDSMPVGYIAYDADWRVTASNDEAAVIGGFDRDTILGAVLWDAFPGTVGSSFEQLCRRVRDTGVTEEFEYFYPERKKWYDVRVQSTSPGIRTYFLDVTERRAALEKAAEHDREVAKTLQRAMLTDLPSLPGVALAARYLPAESTEQVGGDWYDAIVRPGGELAVSVGDVSGHGIGAAASMGQLRAMLRGFTWGDGTVAQSLSRLDQAARGLGGLPLATLVSGRIAGIDGGPSQPHFVWSNAGHPPPLLLSADGTVQRIEAAPELLIGVDPDVTRTDHSIDLPPGSTLVLYTDGVIETPQQPFDAGIERLADALRTHRSCGLDELLDAILDDVRGEVQNDDIAVLAIRILAGAAH